MMFRNRGARSAAPVVLVLTAFVPFLSGTSEAAPQPDIEIVSIVPSNPSPALGSIITVAVTVENAGDVDVITSFVIELFHNPASEPSVNDAGDARKTIVANAGSPLAPGGQKTATFVNITNTVAGTWSMYAIADNTNVIVEGNENNNVGGPVQVDWCASDLVIMEIVPLNANPTVGDPISVAVTVRNQGTADVGSFGVYLFLNETTPPMVGSTGDSQKAVPSLAADATTVVTFVNVVNTVAETWSMYAIADGADVITESDETNNVAGPTEVIWSAGVADIDLTVTAVTPSSATPATGDTITVNVTVENLGTDPVASFRLDLFYNCAAAPGPGDTGDQNQTVGNLAGGGSAVVQFTGVTSAVPADWSMYALVDTLDGAVESAEDNNVSAAASVQWRGVDLVVTAVEPSAASPLMGDLITVDVTVENMGNIASGTFYVGLFYDCPTPPTVGDGADQEKSDSLAAGQSKVLTFSGVTSSSAGTWSMYAVVDNDAPDLVDEYDETNNVAGPVSVTWKGPDLALVSVTPSNSSPMAGDTITVDVLIENQGDANAGAFDVALFYNEGVAPMPGDSADQVQSVNRLNVGKEIVVTFTGVMNAVGELWQMYAIADNVASPGDVAEGDETNNVGGPTSVVWGSVDRPDIVMLSVVPADTNPSIGDAISVDVTVENQGAAGAGSFAVGLFFNEAAPPAAGDAADQTEVVASLAIGAQEVVTFTGVTSAAAGPWSTYAAADNGTVVTESDETNNVSTAATVTWRAPELVITAVTPSVADPVIGATISVDVTVTNNGDADAGAFDVGLLHNEPAPPLVGDAADQTQSVLSLAIGASEVLTFAGITNSVAESWSTYAVADNGTAVLEGDETDNVSAVASVTWRAPDLVITAVALVPPGDPEVDDIISVEVTVENQGDADAGAFDVGLFHNEPAPPGAGDVADETQNVGSLLAGSSIVLPFPGITNDVAETWSTYAIADNKASPGDVSEGDETNNVSAAAVVTWRIPDLVITAIVPSNGSPIVSSTITVDVTVRNQGDADAGPFAVGLFENETPAPSPGDATAHTQNVASLAAGTEATLTFPGITNAAEATWEMYAIADNVASPGAVLEGDETNNVGGPTSVLWNLGGEPDLVVLSVVPSVANPSIGDVISVDVTVENQGAAGAGSSTLALFYNKAIPPSVGDVADQTKNTPTIQASDQVVLTFTGITSMAPGGWNMYAAADNGTAVTESDETNNVSAAAAVTWRAPELVITAVTPSVANPVIGDTISIDVTVRNDGDAPAGLLDVGLFFNQGGPPSVGDAADRTETTVAPLAGGGGEVTLTFSSITNAVAETWSTYAIADNKASPGDVSEGDETDNVSAVASVIWRAPELVVTAVTPSPSNPLVGGTTSVDVTVENQGNADAGAFDVGLFYNEPAPPDAGDVADETQNVGSLAAGASIVLPFPGITNAVAETWSTYAIADNKASPGDVSEGDETDNVSAAAAVTWRIPDLVITAVVPSNGSPTEGNTITVDVTVRNQGDAAAGAFDVGLFYNEAAAPAAGDAADQTQNVASLAAGAETTRTFPGVTNAAAEIWEMYAVADNKAAPGDVSEGDETNNVGGPTSIVWNPALRPDLVVLSVDPSGADPAIGEAISVVVTVLNQGTAGAGSFEVELFYNEAAPPAVEDAGDQTEIVPALGAGVETPLTFTGVTSSVTGAWSMYAVADNGSAVTELDETDNVSEAAAVTWHAPELVITSIVPSNPDPDVGDTITVDVTVENAGDAPAGTFDVGLFYNEPAAPAIDETVDQTETVASLAVGEETTLTFAAIASSSSGDWNMYAAADRGSSVAESDESDNVAGPETVTWHGPDLVVSAITPSDPTPSTADTISIVVTVMNLGDRDAGAFDVGLFRNEASSPSVGQLADQTESVLSLVAGDWTEVTFSGIDNTVEEVWKTWAVADNGSAVTEGDEGNNVGGPTTVTWGTPAVPDLVVVSIEPSSLTPNVDDTITVDVVIANNGTSDASLFDVGLYYDLADVPTAQTEADQTKSVGSIAAGTQKTLTFSGVTSGLSEVWRMYAFVDSGDVIVEANESNNTRGPVEVNWGAVTGITVLVPNGGETWESGTTQQIEWESHGASWTNVAIEYSVNGGTDWLPIVDPTPDDGLYDWEVPLADSAECLVQVTSEGGSYFDESDGVFTIAPPGVGKPNLRIVSISPSISMPSAGVTITVDVTVRNAGNAASGLFYVDLFYNRSTEPAVGETGDQSKPVSILAEGEEANVVFTDVSSALAGVWDMYAVVDTQGYVEESNEGDNVAGPVEVGWDRMVASFRITMPNGWEVLERTQTYAVEWAFTGDPGTLVQIEVSTDGGVIWEVVDGTLNNLTYDWTVSAALPPSSDCRLRISNFLGTVTDVSDDVFTILNAVPTASISATPTSGIRPLSVSFDGAASSDPEGAIALYEWDFDYDGVPADFSPDATGPTAQHTYDEARVFVAALRITDGDGAADVTTTDIPVDSMLYFGSGCAAAAAPNKRAGLAASPLLVFLAGLVRLGRRGRPARARARGTGRARLREGMHWTGLRT